MGRTFFTAANLIDGNSPPQHNATVVVEGERIVAVGGGRDVPTPAARDTVYNLSGKTLMPGMIMSHFHPAYNDINSLMDIELKWPATYLALVAARHAELLLRSGYTSSIGAGTPHNIDATLKEAIRDGLVQGPRMVACGRDVVTTGGPVDVNPDFWKLGIDGLCHVCDGPDEFRKAIREEIKRGADIIKLYVTGGHGFEMSADYVSMTFEEVQAAVQTAHDMGRKVRGHIVSRKATMDALRAHMDLIDHADAMDDQCMELMVKQGTFVTPSLYFTAKTIEMMRKHGRTSQDWLSREERWLEQGHQAVQKAHQAGVKLLIGDDFGTSWMPHGTYTEELDYYVREVGISPLDVITWATRNGAGLLGGEVGTIEAGKLADLLVVKGDPAQDITLLKDRANLDVVMKGGNLVESRLTPAAAPAKAA